MQPTNDNNNLGSSMDVQRPAAPGVSAPVQQVPPQAPLVSSPEPLPPELAAKMPGNKKGSHILAIIIAVIIAVLIIAAAVALFVFTKEKPAPDQTPTTNQPVVDEGVVTGDTIDQTVQVIDQNLNSVNDQNDFTPNDISDQTLGLDEN